MLHELRRLSLNAVCLVVMAALSGCATEEFPPPSEELRQQLGMIGLASLHAGHSAELETPVKGSGAGALSGAGQGALGSIMAGGGVCYGGDPYVCGLGFALGLAIAPIAALVGAGIGAGRAHSAEEVDAADAALRAALAQIDPRAHLQDAVSAALGERPHLTLEPPATEGRAADDLPLAEQGVDTVLELHASTFYLADDGDIDPDVALVMGARGSFLRATDNHELYRRVWAYRSIEHNYFDLALDDAQLLRDEIRDGFAKLGERMVFDLFVTGETEVHSTNDSPPPGTVWTIEVSPMAQPEEATEDPGEPD